MISKNFDKISIVLKNLTPFLGILKNAEAVLKNVDKIYEISSII